ncbi:MAG: flagellar biosynthetic protein FliQ [Acidimicrobiia bacterium]
MNDATVLQVGLTAMIAAAKLAAPILITCLAVGLGVGMLQSVTQIQEVTLTFVPKFVAVGVVVLLAGSWMLTELVSFTEAMFSMIPELISS